MKQEDKELLLKDLCARLPYGVKMNHIADDECSPKTLIGIAKDMITLQGPGGYECIPVEHYKPYLFPMSSMTEEQKEEYDSICAMSGFDMSELDADRLMTFFYKNHIDCHDLIPKGLADDATGLNIYDIGR